MPKILEFIKKGGLNVRTKFHAISFHFCQDISLKATYVNLMVELDEKSGNRQGYYNLPFENHECRSKISIK